MNSIKHLTVALVLAAISTVTAHAASRTAPFVDPTVITLADSTNQTEVVLGR